MKNSCYILPFLLLNILTFFSCGKEATTTTTETPTTETPTTETPTELPAVFAQFNDNIEIVLDGDFVELTANGMPDHPSPYYDPSSSNYEAYNGDNTAFRLNPNTISETSFTFRIPVNPQESNDHQATALGAIGISVNGVAIFNQYAGPNEQALTNEINSFDQYAGHPQGTGVYHYHIEPTYLTTENGKESLIGFLLDGFPVYGPEEEGKTISNSDLDEYHGHFSKTADYPNGIYHYHITDEDPYINGSGYFGAPGTVTR